MHSLLWGPRSPLSPHLFIEVGLHIVPSYSMAHFLAQFQVVPAGLNFLHMNSSHWIHKVHTMDDHLVRINVINAAVHLSIRHPVITVDFGPWAYTPCYDWMESGHIPPIHHLEVASCWRILGGYDAKHPCVPGRSSSSVVLELPPPG